jgi:CDP-glycerol glycerophosphotransferase (TagB/SpsB family)
MRELCNHPQWGKERAEAYYRQWADMPNTQLELGGFVDLFRGSDAMVHDSGSFVIDYMYFNKPVMYIAKDIERTKRQGNQLSRMAYEHHYIGKTQQDITDFVEKTVLGGDDPLKEARLSFRNEYLLPANGKSVARNTYEDMIASLGL